MAGKGKPAPKGGKVGHMMPGMPPKGGKGKGGMKPGGKGC